MARGVNKVDLRIPPAHGDAAAGTEMPRRRSTSRRSVWAVPSSTLPTVRMAPQCRSICSVGWFCPYPRGPLRQYCESWKPPYASGEAAPVSRAPPRAPFLAGKGICFIGTGCVGQEALVASLPYLRRGGRLLRFFRRGTAWACPCPPLRPHPPHTCPRLPGKAARTWCPA